MAAMSGGLRVFDGAIAVITGGASGIGLALARGLAARGASVVIADRQVDLARDAVAQITTSGGRAEALELDVRDVAAVEAGIATVFERHGRLDFLFNNAGIGVGGEVLEYSVADWDDVIGVDLLGVAYGVQAAYGRMVRQGFGHIVNTASMAGLMPAPFTVSYGAAKHGVVGLSRSLRAEASHHGVRVSVLCPGVIRTPILAQGGRYGRMLPSIPESVQREMMDSTRPMNVDLFAARCLPQIAANREIIVVPSWWKAVWYLNRISPALGTALASRFFLRARRAIEENRNQTTSR
jgi:NAD(P)-dependent dehydrogenase (short-subunit alcohol dehydrogenase family)